MADVRHANYDALKSCARVTGVKQQQVTAVRLPPSSGSMSSSPASLDVDVNSLSTTSSTASSCLPLVPTSARGAAVSGKVRQGAAPCGQSRGTSNDIVRSSSAAVSGPGSIITYIDCNSSSPLHRHQPFCSSSQEEAHDGDDEGEDEVTQASPTSASCLQVRRGSEPVLNAVHRFQADEEDLLTANCDNSKRWSTAIAVDSSARKGCSTQSKGSSESLVSLLPPPSGRHLFSPSSLRFITSTPNAIVPFPSLSPFPPCRPIPSLSPCFFSMSTACSCLQQEQLSWAASILPHDCQGREVQLDTSCRLSHLSSPFLSPVLKLFANSAAGFLSPLFFLSAFHFSLHLIFDYCYGIRFNGRFFPFLNVVCRSFWSLWSTTPHHHLTAC